MSRKPLILVTNDDGITAPGMRALIQVMKQIGEVVVVAPDKAQSGMGHAMTLNNTLTLEKVNIDSQIDLEYACSGTPVDCVKIALSQILDRKPDLCVSGVNHGSNSSINVIYSGTMSAALEAGMSGIPSIGFSLLDFSWDADFEPIKPWIKQIVEKSLKNGIPTDVVLNVNFPKLALDQIKGVKVCRQAKATWREDFDKRVSPHGKEYYWLKGEFVNFDKGQDTDEWALNNGYISMVPVHFDLTAYHSINRLNTWDFDEK